MTRTRARILFIAAISMLIIAGMVVYDRAAATLMKHGCDPVPAGKTVLWQCPPPLR